MDKSQNETQAAYIAYIMSQLATVNQSEALASYDTGYGLHLTNVSLGDECHCMDVLGASILKLRPPNISGDFDTWELAWNEARRIVNRFVSQKAI
jgi:hypothetical protein